jgi:hypothetical protein
MFKSLSTSLIELRRIGKTLDPSVREKVAA